MFALKVNPKTKKEKKPMRKKASFKRSGKKPVCKDAESDGEEAVAPDVPPLPPCFEDSDSEGPPKARFCMHLLMYILYPGFLDVKFQNTMQQ